ncbi:MAG: aldo/keto reductase [Chloroflexi bacterium]|nr:aldo/keto reductase [Chloroflexota bacterium]
MQKRPYGNTGEQLSIIGFGGILVMDTQPAEASALVAEAIDRGINYFDVAPTYGNAEECLGPALEPYRKGVFLACKTTRRRGEEAQKELHNSLKLLRTGHFDLYQLHGMTSQEDFDQATAPGGALEMIVKAQKEGLVRHIGFSAHSAEIALALLDHFPFASVLFPINWSNYFNADFGPQVVDKAVEKGAARLALKGLAYGRLAQGAQKRYAKCWYEAIDEPELASLALRFTLSQPITAAIPPGEAPLFRLAMDIAEQYAPLSEAEMAALKQKAGESAPLFRLQSAA